MSEVIEEKNSGEIKEYSKGYGKRPLWQWIVLYVVIGLVVYAAIYYFFFAKKGGYNANSASNNYVPTATPSSVSPTVTVQLSEASQPSQGTITLTASGFSPATLTIKKSVTVTWINQSGQDATVDSDPHPLHTDYPPLNLGTFSDGQVLLLTFPKSGTYGYHNHLNPSERGTIIVE